MSGKKKKTIWALCIIAFSLVAVIVLFALVLPPIRAHAEYEQAIGFVPPWEELEFQQLKIYTKEGKLSKYSDFAAKYVIDTDQFSDAEKFIENVKNKYDNGEEDQLYWIGRIMPYKSASDYYFEDIDPNFESELKGYKNLTPSPWWSFNQKDILQDYFGTNNYNIYILFVSGNEDNVYIYIYVRLGSIYD